MSTKKIILFGAFKRNAKFTRKTGRNSRDPIRQSFKLVGWFYCVSDHFIFIEVGRLFNNGLPAVKKIQILQISRGILN